MIVNQWVPSAHRGDAVGDYAWRVRDLLRGWGHESEIYALQAGHDLASETRSWLEPEARDGDVTMLHFATASPMSAAFGTVPGARVLMYHNVTPAHFVAPYVAGLARIAATGRAELAALATRVDWAVGFSISTSRTYGTSSTRISLAPSTSYNSSVGQCGAAVPDASY